jgi:hypothetical protein
MKVFINRINLETKPILDWDQTSGDTEFWDEELELIEKEWTDYIIIEKMDSTEAFKIMEGFINEIDDKRLRDDLIKILNRRSPFANFKSEVEMSRYRQKWFDFRHKKYEEYVREQLKFENIEFE